MTAVYALRTDFDSTEENAKFKRRIFESVKAGVARFGWSASDDCNLERLQERVESRGVGALRQGLRQVWRCRFLLDVEPGDYLIYVNVPSYGECTLARVTKEYSFKLEWSDFNHRLGVDPESVRTFSRSDAVVPPSLARRLSLPGRYWRISSEGDFTELLEALNAGRTGTSRGPGHQLDCLRQRLKDPLDRVAQLVHECHPNKTLEPLVASAFRRVPGVLQVHERRGRADDRGADLELVYGPDLPELENFGLCAVQVKSYEGTLGWGRALEDVRRAFASDSNYTSALIVSTALEMSAEFEAGLSSLREEVGRPVGVLLGKDLALFILRHGLD